MTPDVQQIVAALFDALGIHVPSGAVTLNIDESQLQSVETKIRVIVRKRLTGEKLLDRRPRSA